MPIDTTPSKVATSALQSIPFESLIGGPLDAAIKAEALAAQTSWQFIKEVGLTGPENNKRAVTVDFIYVSNGREVRLVVPLLAIVPIPYIAVNDITIDFKANIAASSSVSQEDTTSETIDAGGEGEVKVGWGIFSADIKFHANYSSKKDSRASQDSRYSVEYTMDVHVGASQSDMPAGLGAVLNILQQSITATIPEANLQVAPKSIAVDKAKADNKPYKFTVNAFDKKGLRRKDITITATPGTAPTGVTLGTITPATITTDGDGSVTITLPISTADTVTSGTFEVSLSATIDGESVTAKVPMIVS